MEKKKKVSDKNGRNQKKTPKDIFTDTLKLKKTERYPVAPHWWGIYKYEVLGLDYKKDAWQEGEKIAVIYSKFYDKFNPDWFHLHIGTPVYFKNSEVLNRDGKNYLVVDPAFRKIKSLDRYFSVGSPENEEIIDFADFILGSRSNKPKVDLSSKSGIDDFIARFVHLTAEDISELGYTRHVRLISEEYGDTVFIAAHIPSAICEIFDPITGYTGFERGLISFHDFPGGMRYLLEKCYEEQLEWAKAYAGAGAHAYAISEAFISPDIAGPDVYRRFVKDIHRDYFAEVKKMGLASICYFTGDVNPILDDLAEINIDALMTEESKKGFVIDVKNIRERIGDRVCIFGNLDSIYLLHDGMPGDVYAETQKQLEGAKNNFITCNGSPITPGTPKANIIKMIEAGKSEVF